MKAGIAGSNPDGVATSSKEKTVPHALLLREIGHAVFSLNTTVVGLDAVENGYKKPEGLNISWDPSDREIAARKTRKFILESVLVHVSEALNQYIIAMSSLPRFANIRERWDAPKADNSFARRFADIAESVIGSNEFLVPASILLIHWRNRVVHKNSKAKLLAKQKNLLRSAEAEIADKYDSLSVDCLLCHFEEGRPSLKDISTLIAMSINLTRRIDSKILESFGFDDLQAWLDYYEVSPLLEKVKRETKPEKLDASIRRVFLSNAPQLFPVYERFSI